MKETVILLVDDEKTVLDSLKQQIHLLFDGAFDCETAEHVEEAREVLDELATDEAVKVILIVSDWLMPDIKGDVFLEEVRARHPRIHRVMLTGQADPGVLDRVGREAIAHTVLHKPWSEQDLRDVVALASGDQG